MDPKQLQQIVEEAISTVQIDAIVTFRPMFGGILGYVDGKAWCSLSNVGLAFKLSPTDQEGLIANGGVRLQYEPNQPPSKQYIVIPTPYLEEPNTVGRWAAKSAAFVATLPEKKKAKG